MPRKKGKPTKSTIKALDDGTVAITINPGSPGPVKLADYLVFRIANLTRGVYLTPQVRKRNCYKQQFETKDGFVYATVDQLLIMLIAHAEFAKESAALNSPDKVAHNWPIPIDATLIAYEASIRGMQKLPSVVPTRDEILEIVRGITKCPELEISKGAEIRIGRYLKYLRSVRNMREKTMAGTLNSGVARLDGRTRAGKLKKRLIKERKD